MTGWSESAESASKWAILISADVSRDKGVLRSSDDEESRCERLTPIVCAELSVMGVGSMKVGSTFDG
jgi:hypothetical protein